jgi:regulator of RNase E activity RraA
MADDFAVRLRKLDSCAVSDSLDALGIKGTVYGLYSTTVKRRIAGRIQTVKLGPADSAPSKRHLCTAAVDAAQEGDVIVVENHHRPDAAGWGGILSTAAAYKKLSGTIVDGPARDADESEENNYPVYARSSIASTARGRIAEHEWNTPIDVGGVTVKPGDLVIADGSGVVFVPAGKAGDVLDKAEEIQARERAMAAAVLQGKPVSAVMGGDYEDMLKKK